MIQKKYDNLIVVPVGVPIDTFCKDEKLKTHWRRTENERNYQILAVQYGDFVPEEGTYDDLIVMKGFKWPIAKQLNEMFDFTEWDYVGFYDDDVVIEYQSINTSFDMARQNNFQVFQISLSEGSESNWKSTQNIKNAEFAYTNFIEIMCPVFSRTTLPKIMELINSYDIFCGWGLDYVLAEYLSVDPVVIHKVSMYHPPRPNTGSTYNKQKAFQEMNDFLNNTYPQVMMKQGRNSLTNYGMFKDNVKLIINE